MPRPAIIIGLGGTGSWVLSWLKKDLLETYGTLDGLPVHLLLLDTADIIAEVGASGGVERNQYLRFNDIDQSREFIQLPTDKAVKTTRDIDNAVRQREPHVEHLSHWFCGGHFPGNVLSLSDGAGKFRQLGRLSLVQGIHSSGTADPVYARLQNMVQDILRKTRSQDAASIDVHITGSFVGGSGGGIFLDIAWLLRKIIRDDVKLFISGIFAMPGVFTQNPSRPMRTKAFNAWRELNRMMTIDKDNSSFLLRWGRGDETIYKVDSPAYDHVYLVDSGPGGAPLTEKPQDSVFPIMAEAISFFLDDQSGEKYIQHIRTNLNEKKIAFPFRNRPTFSTLYVKSWKLPHFHNINVARHNFAIRYLKTLLQIQEHQEQDINGNTRQTYSLPEVHTCFQRSTEVLASEMPGIGSTQFIQSIAEVINIPRVDYDIAVRNYADVGYDILDLFAQMPQVPEGRAVAEELDDMVNFAIRQIDTNVVADEIVSQMFNVERRLYGGNTRTGGEYLTIFGEFEVNRNRGQLYEKLSMAEELHLQVFQQRVQFWIQRELNNYANGHSGLACAISAMNDLVSKLEYVIGFYEDVETELSSIIDMRADAEQRFHTAIQKLNEINGLFGTFWEKMAGAARTSVQQWRQAETRYLSAQRDRRGVQRIISTLSLFYDFIKNEVIRKLTAIEQQLVTDNTVDRVVGLYRGLYDSLENEHERHRFDQKLNTVTHLLENEDFIPEPSLEKVQDLIQRSEWSVDENMNINLSIRVSDNESPIELAANIGDKQQTQYLVQQLIVSVADRIVVDVDQQNAMDVIELSQLESELPDARNTLFAIGEPQHEEVRTFYVRGAMTPSQKNKLSSVIESIGIPREAPHAVDIVGSANPNKIVVFSARELLLPENFGEWNACLNSYQTQVRGAGSHFIEENFQSVRCDHLFSGEKNALELERLYYKATGEFPTLNHRLVHLLEERDRFEQFLRLWVLKWVDLRDGQRQEMGSTWLIDVPSLHQPIHVSRDEDIDIVSMMARYITHGQDLRGVELPYDQIHTRLHNEINDNWYKDPDKFDELHKLYLKEENMAIAFHEVIREGLRSNYSLQEFDASLDDFLRKEREESDYHTTLAEFVAYDFTRKRGTGEPLISNVEAHEQLLGVVLKQMFSNLALKWEGKKPRNNTDSLSGRPRSR